MPRARRGWFAAGRRSSPRRRTCTSSGSADAQFAWAPRYSLVSGDLAVGELPNFSVWTNTAEQSVVRFQLDVTTPGAAALNFNSVEGLTLYLGAAPVDTKPQAKLDLKAGVQTLTLFIDRSIRKADLRIELEDVPGSPARVAVVGGK
jgi:hypothetical protein